MGQKITLCCTNVFKASQRVAIIRGHTYQSLNLLAPQLKPHFSSMYIATFLQLLLTCLFIPAVKKLFWTRSTQQASPVSSIYLT